MADLYRFVIKLLFDIKIIKKKRGGGDILIEYRRGKIERVWWKCILKVFVSNGRERNLG